jgi:hypothetical protein
MSAIGVKRALPIAAAAVLCVVATAQAHQSNFSTVVSSVAGANPSSSDSAAVVQTVERYGAALAAGDSSAAIALLTADGPDTYGKWLAHQRDTLVVTRAALMLW